MDYFRLLSPTPLDWVFLAICVAFVWLIVGNAKDMDHFHHGIIRRLRENPPRRCYTGGYNVISARPYQNRQFPKRAATGIPLFIAMAGMIISGNLLAAFVLSYGLYRDLCYHYRYLQYKRTYELTET